MFVLRLHVGHFHDIPLLDARFSVFYHRSHDNLREAIVYTRWTKSMLMAQPRLSLISRDNMVRLSCRSLTVRVRAATEVIPRWQGLRMQRTLLPFGHGHVPFGCKHR